MGTAGAEPIWARPSENTMAPLLVFQVKQGEVIPGTQIIPQEGPVKGKLRSGAQGYRRFQNRPNGAGLPGGIKELGGSNPVRESLDDRQEITLGGGIRIIIDRRLRGADVGKARAHQSVSRKVSQFESPVGSPAPLAQVIQEQFGVGRIINDITHHKPGRAGKPPGPAV